MKIRRQFFLALFLLFGSISALGQNPKQELNDKFWEAVRKGDLAAVTSLLDQGAEVNAKFRYGTTALFKAAERGHVEIVKLLLARGADVTVKDTFYGATAMTWALDNDHVEVVTALLQKAPAEAGDVLMTGVRDGKPPLVRVALASGSVKPETLTTALFKAAERGHVEIVKLLLARGADVTVKDTFYGATAMTWALDNDHVEVVTALLQKAPAEAGDVLMTGVRDGKPPLVRVALASGSVKPETLTAALVVATDDKDKTEIAEMLKGAGAVAPPAVDATMLQSYVGKYKDEAGTEISITLTAGRLSAVPTGQRPFVLMAIDSTSFRPVAFEGIVLSFKVEAGNTTGVELKRGQITTQLKRVVETKQP